MGVFKNIKFSIGYKLSNSATYIRLLPMLGIIPSKNVVTKNHHICIDGFQRCGNTYFTFLVQNFNRQLKIGHHTHGAGNILLALKYNIPVVLLVRNPLDAVSSLIAQDQNLNIEFGLAHYIAFYKKLIPYKNRLIISDFDQTVNHPDRLIEKINNRFNLTLTKPDLSENRKKDYLKRLKQIDNQNGNTNLSSLAPNEEKEKLKTEIKEKIQQCRQIKEAISAYQELYN